MADVLKTYLGKGWKILSREEAARKGIAVINDLVKLRATDEIDIAILDDYRKGHFWCFGTTRVGKTRVIENMVEQDIRKGYSVVIIDPKGDIELFSKVTQIAAEEHRLEDLILVTPIFPEYSAVIDPLSHYYMPEELVSHLVAGIDVGQGDAFFFNVAYEVTSAIVNAKLLLQKYSDTGEIVKQFNINDIKNEISQDRIKELLKQIQAIETPEAQQLAMDVEKIAGSPPDYYAKVSSTLRVALMELSVGNIGQIIGKADSNRFMTRLEEGHPVIMVVQLGSLITRKASSTLGKVCMSMIQSYVGRVFSSGRKVDPPMCVYMDEAQSFLFMGVEDLFAKGGGANVWVHGFSQSVNQLYAAVGEEYAKSILDNTNTKLFMRVPDTETAEYVSKHFGTKKRLSPILSVGGKATMKESEEDVLTPENIMYQQPREFFMMTYSGRYMGRTNNITPPWFNVEFPKTRNDGSSVPNM